MYANAETKRMDQTEKATEGVHHNRQSTAFGKIKDFLWHLAQMVLAMEAGMAVYHALLGTILAGTGYAALTRSSPVLGYWVMVVAMTVPMVALMRVYHKSTWRYCLGMTAAMVSPVIPLTIMVLIGFVSTETIRGCGIGDVLMILSMAAYMLVRPGSHNHGSHKESCH